MIKLTPPPMGRFPAAPQFSGHSGTSTPPKSGAESGIDKTEKRETIRSLMSKPPLPIRFTKGLVLFMLAPVIGPPQAIYKAIQKNKQERAWKERARQVSEHCKREREREAAYYNAVSKFVPTAELPLIASNIQKVTVNDQALLQIINGAVTAGNEIYQVRYEKFLNGPKFKRGEISDSQGRKWTFALDEDDHDPRWGGFHNTQYTDEKGQVFTHRYNRALMQGLNEYLDRHIVKRFWQALQPGAIEQRPMPHVSVPTPAGKGPTPRKESEAADPQAENQFVFEFV